MAGRSDALPVVGETDVTDDVTECTSQRRACLLRWWPEVFSRRRHKVVTRGRRSRDDDDGDADDCWRLFPRRQSSRAMSADTRDVPSAAVVPCGSPADADDTVRGRRTSLSGDAVTLTVRRRPAAAADSEKSSLEDGRRRRRRVFCIILAGLCIAVVGLLVGGLVIASPATLHYSE